MRLVDQFREIHRPSFPLPPAAAIIVGMPTYAYRCRECSESFEILRPMSESGAPASCPDGHTDTVKLLTTVALTGAAMGSAAPAAGGCCGGGCCG
jgi:putative FmdB family regulatory protein